MSSAGSILRGSSLYSKLIDQLILFESKRKFGFQDQIESQNTRKTAISTVGTAITGLNTLVKGYKEADATQFSTVKPTSSDDSFFTVANSGSLNTTGSFNFEVQQLAKFDTKFSRRFTAADTDLSAPSFDSTEFTINVGSESALINVDLTGVTNNADVMNRVSAAINASGLANVQATVLRETSDSVRLSVRSTQTGADYLISFSDVNDGITTFLSEALELTQDGGTDNSAIYAGAGGGRLYNVADLNAKFSIDGLAFERTSNTVTDAISGLNITLKKATTQTESINIDKDTAGIKTNIESFITAFNKVNSDVRAQTFLNSVSGTRGPLYSDRVFRELTFTLRDIVGRQIEVEPGVTLSLTQIGIDSRTDGSLYIKDQAKLTAAINDKSEQIQTLFSKTDDPSISKNGLAAQIESAVQNFVGTSSLVSNLNKSVEDRIKQLNDRIKQQDTFLASRRKQYEKQFAQLEALQNSAQSQFQVLSAIGR